MVGMLPHLLLAAAGNPTDVPSAFWVLMAKLAVLLVCLVLPFYLGRIVARGLRMPDYSGKIGAILCALIVSFVVLAPKPAWLFLGWPPKLGIDLKGGVILVYEVDLQGRNVRSAEEAAEPGATGGTDINMNELVTALTKRINPDGLKEIVIRPFGEKQVEIIIPDVDPLEIERIKKLIGQAGILEFRIVANGRDHRDVVDLAVAQSEDPVYGRSREVKDEKGKVVGFWARVARDETPTEGRRLLKVGVWRETIRDIRTGQLLTISDQLRNEFDDKKGAFEQYLESQGVTDVEVLMYAVDGYDVLGSDLAGVSTGFEGLDPKVDFGTRTADAARRMGGLTGSNLPDGNFTRQLGIVLDGQLLSAPAIRGTITDRGQITGQFTQAEVDFLVGILRAGQLPAALNKVPVSENQIGSLLGGDMIVKSAWAIAVSALAVYVFVLYYYRIAGLVASVVLTINIVMILALMILIQAPLTLPGLAGLVLTVGMAVDANVLIFERMREEQARGAALRMVIRNGFDRAFSTILDSNVTTVITAVILYVIGTDQVRGFAVTLTLGLLISMFTAVFCARVIFEIMERKRWVTKFTMLQLWTTTNYDFMRIWKGFTAVSVVIVVLGLVATVYRGQGMLDIDFLGGTSVQPLLNKPVKTDDVRKMLDDAFREDKVQFSLTSIQVAGAEGDPLRDRVFKIDTSEPTVEKLQNRLFEALKDESGASLLATYSVTFDAPRRIEIQRKAVGASKPADEKPADEKPADEKPADEKPADEKPADEKPADEKPADEKPADAKPADAKPADAKPADEKPADEKPADEKPADEKPADEKPADENPCFADDETAVEKPAEPAEAPADKPAEESKLEVKPEESPAAEKPVSEDQAPASADLPVGGPASETPASAPALRTIVLMESTLKFETKINSATLIDRIAEAAREVGLSPPEVLLKSPDWEEGSSVPLDTWTVQLTGSEDEANRILTQLQKALAQTPVFLSSSEVGGQVATDTQQRAIIALLASMVGIVFYIWLRFQHVVWGLAAVLALVHDVLVMLAFIALSLWMEPVMRFLMVEEFKINLTMIAAFLTLVGYSINDTIVLFDRLREIRGKSPNLTRDMINQAINQTLSRTILTALTVFIVVVILYFFGGQSIHGFAFAMVVGTFAGSYSSIYIAAPVLLQMSTSEKATKPEPAAVEK